MQLQRHPARFCAHHVVSRFGGLVCALLLLAADVQARTRYVAIDDFVKIKPSGFNYNRATGTYTSLVRVSNQGKRSAFAPLRLVIRSLPAGAQVANAAGTTAEGFPYLPIALASEALVPGQTTDPVLVMLSNPSNSSLAVKFGVDGTRALLRAPLAQPSALPHDAVTEVRLRVFSVGALPEGLTELSTEGLPSPVQLHDDGQAGDAGGAFDGVFNGVLFVDTRGLPLHHCFHLRARGQVRGIELDSPLGQLCVSDLPLHTLPASVELGEVINHPDLPGIEVIAREVFVVFAPGTSDAAKRDTANAINAEIAGSLPTAGVYQLRFREGALDTARYAQRLAALRADARVRSAVPNGVLRLEGAPRDEPNDAFYSAQHNLTKVGAAEAWRVRKAENRPGGALTIGIIDSEIAGNPASSTSHPDLRDAMATSNSAYACRYSRSDTFVPCVSGAATDPIGHGTAVAGVAAAVANNESGIAGVSWGARLVSFRLYSSVNEAETTPALATQRDMLEALDAGIHRDPPISVFNISAYAGIGMGFCTNSDGGAGGPSPLSAYTTNALIVAAAGNGGERLVAAGKTGNKWFPASCPGVLAVANSTDVVIGGTLTEVLNRTSNYGPAVGLAAPGTNVWSSVLPLASCSAYRGVRFCATQGYKKVTGTSFSSPLVAGAATLLVPGEGFSTDFTPADLIKLLKETGVPITRRDNGTAGGAALSPAIARLDLCAATLFSDPATLLRIDMAEADGSVSIDENAAPGALVGNIVPACDNVSYSVSDPRFELINDGAAPNTKKRLQVKSGAIFDYASQPSYAVDLSVSRGVRSFSKSFRVNLRQQP
jgi:serine protease